MEVHPEVGNLHVHVTDQEGTPISGATVTSTLNPSDQPTLNGTTNSNGYVAFNEVVAGSYTIQAVKSGYVTGCEGVTVSPDQTKTETITLNEKTTPQDGSTDQYPVVTSEAILAVTLTVVVIAVVIGVYKRIKRREREVEK